MDERRGLGLRTGLYPNWAASCLSASVISSSVMVLRRPWPSLTSMTPMLCLRSRALSTPLELAVFMSAGNGRALLGVRRGSW